MLNVDDRNHRGICFTCKKFLSNAGARRFDNGYDEDDDDNDDHNSLLLTITFLISLNIMSNKQ